MFEFMPDHEYGPYRYWRVGAREQCVVRINVETTQVTVTSLPVTLTFEESVELMQALHRMHTWKVAVLDATRPFLMTDEQVAAVKKMTERQSAAMDVDPARIRKAAQELMDAPADDE